MRPDKTSWIIHLHSKDKKILENILQIIESQNKIYGPYSNKESLQIEVNCEEHHSFLTQAWGIDNHKSYTLKWKDCPDEFLVHLVRGYFDGDGSIYTKPSNNPNVNTVGINFTGTHDFIKGLKCAINRVNGFDDNTGHLSDLDTYASLIYNGCDVALKILDWMYLESTELTRLDRKFEKYLEYKRYIQSVTLDYTSNVSQKYIQSTVPDYKTSCKIRFDYKYMFLKPIELSRKYNVSLNTITSIINNITHLKEDDRNANAKIYLEAFGEKKHILDWVNDDRCNVDIGTLRQRINIQGLSPEDAITKLPDSTSGTLKHTFEIDGEEKSITEILKDKGICRSTFLHRVFKLGMDPEEASSVKPGDIPHNNVSPGKLSNNQKYTKEQVDCARNLFKSGESISNISLKLGISESSLYDITSNKSWVDESYFHEKKNSDKIYITYNGKTQSIQEWSAETGIPYSTIDRRYRQNLPLDQVFNNSGKRINLGKVKSEKNLKSDALAKLVREDYKNGLIGKANYEKHQIKKSRYIDIIANRTNEEENVWWK